MSRTSDPAYLRARARLRKQKPLVCWLCGEGIDAKLKFPDPLSFTADHVDPVARGGHNNGPLLPAHLRCNSKRQADDRNRGRTPSAHCLPW